MILNLYLLLIYLFSISIYELYFSKKLNKLNQIFFANFTKAFVLFIFIIIGLKQYKQFDSLIDKLLENTAFVVGVLLFVLQNTLKNIVSGLLLAQSNVFSINDRITLLSKDITGYIEDITLRHTVIRTYQNERIIIPNSIINEEAIANNHFTSEESSYPIEVILPNDKSIDEAINIIKEIVSNESGILNKEVEVLCSSLSDKYYTLKTFIWTKNIDESFKTASQIRIKILNKIRTL